MERADRMPANGTVEPWREGIVANFGVVLARLLSVVTGLAYVKSYTAALSVAEVGFFFYLSTLSYALNALVFVPVDSYMQARLAALETPSSVALRRLIGLTLLAGAGACIVLGAPLVSLGKLRMADLPALYAVAALLYLCMTLRNLLNNRGSKVFVSSMLLLESVGRLLAFLAVAVVFGSTARTLMVSSALALGVELTVILVQLRRRIPLSRSSEPLDGAVTVLRIVAPISGSAVCNALQNQAYRVVYPLAGFGAVSGVFGVVANIGIAGMGACASIFSQLYLPGLYRSAGASIRRYVGHALLLSGGILAFSLVFARLLVKLLTKEQYLPYATAVGFGVVSEACNLVIGGYVVLMSIERRTSLLLKFNAATALLSVGGCLGAVAFAPDNPYLIGVFVAGSQLLMTVSLLVFVRRRDTSSVRALMAERAP